MKKYILIATLLSQMYFSQSEKVQNIIQNFEGKTQTQWAIPLSKKEKINISWHERKSSFSEKENIKTFVGYAENQFVGVISLFKNQISGNLSWQEKNYQILTQKEQILIQEDKTKGHCEITHSHEEHSHGNSPKISLNHSKSMGKTSELNIDKIPEIYTDGVMRIYRLAILVDYSLFRNTAGGEARIKQFWAETETFLNELYPRDLSIRFQIVNDEKLIRKNIAQQVFPISTTPMQITDKATEKINQIIGEKNYDVGVVASYGGTGLNGIAGLFSAYAKHTKADAWVSVLSPATVAHELGHLFGASHTFSWSAVRGVVDAMNTEPSRGQSVMSYSRTLARDFFSLPSINTIRTAILNNADYYTDESRNQSIGPNNSDNIVYGISSQNQSPIINRSKIKPEYILPQGSYFQFQIPAKDPDGHSLLYMAHQADIRLKEREGFAMVRSAKAQKNATIPFYQQYQINENQSVALVEHSAPNFPISGNQNERNFWLGVSDGAELDKNPHHAVRYDMVPTKIKFVEGTAFRLLTSLKKNYTAGEKIMLRWGVDKAVFQGTKVKISMSDDFGQSWKYVLNPDTENDGEEEITLPPIEVGKKQHSATISSGAGLIKIEVLDHIAVAISNHHPISGGFEVKKSQIWFKNLPEQNFSVKENEIPAVPILEAETSCSNHSVSVVYKGQTQEGNVLKRVWEATDTCQNQAVFKQFITLEKNVTPLQFVGELPKNLHISCLKQGIENPENLQFMGGNSPKMTFTQTKVEGDFPSYTLKRSWIVTDTDAEPIMHTQMIVIHDGEKPILSQYPADKTIKTEAEMPPFPSITATDNCDENVEVTPSSYVEFENGLKVYKNSWTARDASGNTTRHEQKITIDPNYTPPAVEPLAWENFPSDKKVSCENLPPVENPTTKGGEKTPTITHFDQRENGNCANSYTIKRTYTATDGKTSISKTQTIEIEDKTPPVFVEKLPENLEILEGENIPVQENLTAKDNCSQNVSVLKSEEKEKNKITYTWRAKDDCGNEVSHHQIITIKEKVNVKETENQNSVVLYPNPTSGIFYIENLKNIENVKIYNAAGRLVGKFLPQKKYDVSHLSSGTYVIVIKTKTEKLNFKLIKN